MSERKEEGRGRRGKRREEEGEGAHTWFSLGFRVPRFAFWHRENPELGGQEHNQELTLMGWQNLPRVRDTMSGPSIA
eukprot:1371673-Rhodomonas_salina.1